MLAHRHMGAKALHRQACDMPVLRRVRRARQLLDAGVKLDTRKLFENATWKGPDGVIHSVGPWGVRCGHVFRRLPRPSNEPRTVTCVACIAQHVEDDADESED